MSRSCLVAGLITLPKGLRDMTEGYVVLVSLCPWNLERIEYVVIPLDRCKYFGVVNKGPGCDWGSCL